MVTWQEARATKLASMTEAERAEYDALGPQVEAELAAAELIYQARIEAGLTQAELAKRMDTRQNYISALERGERTPTVSTLARVAAATGKKLALAIS